MRLVSVDPGTVTCGVAVWDLNKDFTIDKMRSFTIYINGDMELDRRMGLLYKMFKQFFIEEEPFQLAHETGFINRFRPQAYGPIYTTIYLIRKAFSDTVSDYGLFGYPPKMVKSVVSIGTAGKDDMLAAVTSINELKSFITGKESEHEIDAIAIGYTHILNIRMYPEILFI